MENRKDNEKIGSEAAIPGAVPEQKPAVGELPSVESPPLSPAAAAPVTETTPEPVIAAAPVEPEVIPAVETPAPETAQILPFLRSKFILKPRHKRYAVLTATVTLAAAFGAVIGAVASSGFSSPPPRVDVARVEEDKAMQQSVARLAKEVTTLRANLEAANKSAHTQIAKINERFQQAAAEITGSISPPQIVAPQAAVVQPAPLPPPRPAIADAAAPPPRPQIVQDWTIRETRSGYVYVENRGAIYQVVPGAPLPGLGPVESVRRQDGRWIVLTPRGIIVSMRDRRYFDPY